MKNHKLGILKVRDNFQSCGEIESTQEFEFAEVGESKAAQCPE
jgi:hypothetical protein